MIWVRALDRNEIFKMGEEAVRGFSRFALPRWCFAPLFAREPQMRTHLSRLSGRAHDRLCYEQFRQPAQIDRQHGQCEHVADFRLATQLDLTDRCAMLLAITEQRLDQLARHLTDPIAVVPGRAAVDPAFALRPFAVLVAYS